MTVRDSKKNCKSCNKPVFAFEWCAAHSTEARKVFEQQSGQSPESKESSEEAILNAFAVFDTEGNGCANTGALRHVLTTLGDIMSQDEVSEMVAEADGDYMSGSINYHSFVKSLSLAQWTA